MNQQDSTDLSEKKENIKDIFIKLSTAVSKNDHQQVIKLSDEIQKISLSDAKLEKSKVIALIKLDKYEEALQIIFNKLSTEKTLFETAYCLFMLERFEEAVNYIKENNERSILHVKAQITYQTGQVIEAVQLYQKLIKDPYRIENEDFDLNVNLLAAQVTLPSIEVCNDSDICQSMDYNFNIGCHLIHKKEYEKAKKLFELSRGRLLDSYNVFLIQNIEQCLSTICQEDIESRMHPILIQLAYIYSHIGQEQEALNIYEDLMKKSHIDPTIKLIATNNFFSIKPNTNPYLAFCSMNSALSNIKLSKLTKFQNKIISKNIAILNLYCEKYSACNNIIKKIQNKYPDDNTIILILVSSILARFTGNQACTQLMELHEKNPSNIPLSLAIIQFMISSKNIRNAQKIMEKLLDSLKENKNKRFSPGLIRLAVEIYERRGREDLAQQELYAASKYWRSTGSNDPKLIELLYASGKSKLKNIISKKGNPNISAIDDFSYLLKISPNNQKALAGLTIYYLNTDISEALKYANKLPSPDLLIQKMDANYLEKSGIINHLSKKRKTNQSEPSLKQKKKKSKLPKNYDPNKQPDPERWIPKKLRSYYKPPKEKKKKSNRTQGELASENSSMTIVSNTKKHTNKYSEKRK
ncbi:uncharacterized protein T551_02880 [Pneumocystis jirovecii RU7]|uniref:Signal recognition particle subunit SRP72 n=1 Tax=Pneumocystis jirovecii (strain RU7) TaxID=1408657 RepID=A0A0W4ZHS3_PNEJ7|nr:uncharacterized protein T551_02880 [Pneumocystis jirovecii RU7]KTW27913.1 hypothetical protein T551_02880 [Pneumocystis jirovecii RU7]